MNPRNGTLKQTYERMSTTALLELYAAGTLTDEACVELERVLRERAVPVPQRPEQPYRRLRDPARRSKKTTSWSLGFAAIGVVVPVACLSLDLAFTGLRGLCEICWPTGVLMLAVGTQFNLALALVSIGFNALLWAGLGWLIGYGTSR